MARLSMTTCSRRASLRRVRAGEARRSPSASTGIRPRSSSDVPRATNARTFEPGDRRRTVPQRTSSSFGHSSGFDGERMTVATIMTSIIHGDVHCVALVCARLTGRRAQATLLNVSYDPTASSTAFNAAFAKFWAAKSGGQIVDHPAVARADPARRLDRSSTASKPTSSRWRWRTTSTPSRKAGLITPAGRSACRRTARPTPRRSCSSCGREIRRASRTGTIWSGPAFR